MSLEFFRQRDRFDFSKDTLDIGHPLFWDRESFLKHFFLRVVAISADRWQEFYHHHLSYYLKKHPDANEEIFFRVLWQLLETRLKSLRAKDIYESKTHERDIKEIQQLESFTKFLSSIDRWNSHETERGIMIRLQKELNSALNLVEKLKADLKEAKNLEPSDQINIPNGYALTLADIFIELQKLKVDAKHELVFSRTQAVWMKMICRYFTEDHKPIKLERLKRYFSPDPDNPDNVKYSEIPANKKLFKFETIKKRSI
jgi:hypothetical protein